MAGFPEATGRHGRCTGHTPSVVPFGLVGSPMLATYHNATFLAAGVPVFDIRAAFGSTDIVMKSPERGAARRGAR